MSILDEQVRAIALRFPALKSRNAARTTLAWLEQKIAERAAAIDEDWREVRARMQAVNARTTITSILSIDNDFWICKRANPVMKPDNALSFFSREREPWSAQQWWPPEDWREWPLFYKANDTDDWIGDQAAVVTKIPESFTGNCRVDCILERAQAMDIIVDLMMDGANETEALMVTQATAWLDTALGRMGRFMERHVGRDIDPGQLLIDLDRHVLAAHSTLGADMMEDALQILFGSALTSPQTLNPRPSPRGQSYEWRDYFRSLGRAMPQEHTLMAVQLAASALRSESVWVALGALQSAGRSGHGENFIDLSMCIRRRWLMAVKALAWVEGGLDRAEPFEHLTAADLMCFAIDSLLPLYPRPVVAVSHRGADAKPSLAASAAWGANEVMLDATFQPVWQTNRAMVWSLFASTPVLCKIRSVNYDSSEWCRRESEMFDYLTRKGDFLRGRRVFEIDLESVGVLDRVARSNPRTHRWLDGPSGADSPPMELRRMEAWEGAVLRAAGAARLVGRFMAFAEQAGHTPRELANLFLQKLYSDDGEAVPTGDLMGFSQGWRSLAAGLRADASAVALKGPLAQVARDETVEDAERWFETVQKNLADVRSAELSPCDFYAALQWHEHLQHYLREHEAGTIWENQAAIIDLRDTNADEWRTHPGWTVARGLIFLRLPYPIIVRQRAGQNTETWPLLRDLDIPMFTEHLPGQRLPQNDVFFLLGGSWPGVFADAVKDFVTLESSLEERCRATMRFGPDPVMMRADGGLSTLSVEGSDFVEWLRKQAENEKSE